MDFLGCILVVILSYILGAIPFGYVITKLKTGKDIRQHESGRTGTTNTMRVAGFYAGVLTVILDVVKGALPVLIARWSMPHVDWLPAVAPLAAIIGHNYSIFLIKKEADGKIHLGGGAGGAPALGGAIALWPQITLFIAPIGLFFWYGVGYASLATMSVGLVSAIVFITRAALSLNPWAYAAYGILVEIIVLWALRPNIQRLMNGTERLVGWRAQRRKKTPEA